MSHNEKETSTPQNEDTMQEEKAGDVQHEGAETAPSEESAVQPDPLEELKKQLSETEDRYKRVLAEYQNFRTRTQRERESLYLDSVASTVEAFLPVMDTLERAVMQETDEGFKDSLGRIVKQYSDCLEKFNIKPFGQIGEVFNPKFHNAVMQSDEEGLEPNTIAEVFSKGYAMGDRIIRYAMVKVAN